MLRCVAGYALPPSYFRPYLPAIFAVRAPVMRARSRTRSGGLGAAPPSVVPPTAAQQAAMDLYHAGAPSKQLDALLRHVPDVGSLRRLKGLVEQVTRRSELPVKSFVELGCEVPYVELPDALRLLYPIQWQHMDASPSSPSSVAVENWVPDPAAAYGRYTAGRRSRSVSVIWAFFIDGAALYRSPIKSLALLRVGGAQGAAEHWADYCPSPVLF